MEELVQFVENYLPGFRASIAPADEDEIEDLENIAGPLPGVLLRFLRTMGSSMGDFKIPDVEISVEIMRSAYTMSPERRSSRHMFLAQNIGLSGIDYLLDRDTPFGEDDCMVVIVLTGARPPFDGASPWYAGLEEMLYVEAFKNLRLRSFKRRIELSDRAQTPRENGAKDCRALAERLGFKRLPHAQRSTLYERGDAAMVVREHPIEPIPSVLLASDDGNLIAQVEDTLFKRFRFVQR